jgi:hypothetical protein
MGANSSRVGGIQSLQELEEYARKAKNASELSDKLLQGFFTQLDFQDLLSLSNLSSCSKYVFIGAQALDTIFTKIQVEPQFGPQGEILFVPIRSLIPFEEKGRPTTQDLRDRLVKRNQMCVNVAYIYVRMFQIYAALALTVLDTYPGRRSVSVPQMQSRQQAKPGQPLFFSGGALSVTRFRELKRKGPVFALSPVLSKKRGYASEGDAPYVFDDPRKGQKEGELLFYMKDIQGADKDNHSYIQATWMPRVGRNKSVFFTVERSEEDRSIYKLLLESGKKPIAEFQSEEKIDTSRLVFPDTVEEFFDELEDQILQTSSSTTSNNKDRKRTSTTSTSSYTNPMLPQAAPGKTYFEGYDPIKKLYDDKFNGKGFPKAFCTARAMQLMAPLFVSETYSTNGIFYSQICSKTFDFETSGDFLPRFNRSPGATPYFRSLISLYYDEYQVVGDKITPVKTESGRSDLRKASSLVARLYNVKTSPEEFLESQKQIPKFVGCENEQLFRFVNEDFRSQFFQQFIKPMLDFQEQHSQRVNKFLMSMFEVQDSATPLIRFAPSIKQGGKQQINQFGSDARHLLLEYYLRSEAMFISAVIQLERFLKDPTILQPVL